MLTQLMLPAQRLQIIEDCYICEILEIKPCRQKAFFALTPSWAIAFKKPKWPLVILQI